jgi:hypothetical protein
MKTINIFLIFCFLAVGNACQQKPEEQEEKQTPAISDEGRADFRKVMPNFPSAAEFSAQLQATGAEFNPSILTDPDKAEQYAAVDEKSAAMLGAYMYDLGYCAAYQKSSYTNEYFKAAQMLAQNLGGEKGFLEMVMERYKDNINKHDSVKAYFQETYQHATQTIGESPEEQEYLRTLFLAGFYIEGLHNLLQVINTYPRDELPDEQAKVMLTPIINSVLRQKDNVYNLSRMLDDKVFELDNALDYQNAFSQLNDLYSRLNIDQLIAENRINEVVNDDVLQEMIEKVNEIRNRLVAVPGQV